MIIVFEFPTGHHHGVDPDDKRTWPIADAKRGGVVEGSIATAAERFHRADGEVLAVGEFIDGTVVQY